MPCMVKFSVIVDFGHPLISVYGPSNQKAEICNKIKATQHLPPADDMSFSKLLCSKSIALHPGRYRQIPNLPIKPKKSNLRARKMIRAPVKCCADPSIYCLHCASTLISCRNTICNLDKYISHLVSGRAGKCIESVLCLFGHRA